MQLKICWFSSLIFTPFGSGSEKKLGVWIRIHMEIFGILDPDAHENLCGSETLF